MDNTRTMPDDVLFQIFDFALTGNFSELTCRHYETITMIKRLSLVCHAIFFRFLYSREWQRMHFDLSPYTMHYIRFKYGIRRCRTWCYRWHTETERIERLMRLPNICHTNPAPNAVVKHPTRSTLMATFEYVDIFYNGDPELDPN